MNGEMLEQYKQLHSTRKYGSSSKKVAPEILAHIRILRPDSVIDYGCGQSILPDLIAQSGVPLVKRYDPAIPAYADRPKRSFDLLVNVDVLEHIPEPEIDDVISDMAAMAKHAIIVIDTRVAKTILPNGQNAHATIRPNSWWRDRLAKFYPVIEPITVTQPGRASFKTWSDSTTNKIVLWILVRKYRLDYFRLRRRERKAKHTVATRIHQ